MDIGAGTGELGRFVGNGIPDGIRYVGFDVSRPMLEVFADKLNAAQPPASPSSSSSLLTVADANAHWPVVSGSTAVIFFSRAIHLLSQEHVVRESLRIAHPKKASLTIGRVRRSQDSVRSMMRSEMPRILSEQGITGKGGEKAHRELVSRLDSPLCRFRAAGQKTLARWQVKAIPAASLTSWRGKDGLAGVAVSASVKQTVLDQLERWAVEHFGDLQTPQTSQEGYDLTVFETHD